MRKKGKHCRGCKEDFPSCPCNSCIHDNYKANEVEYDACCGKHERYRNTTDTGHSNCLWKEECPDYVKEG